MTRISFIARLPYLSSMGLDDDPIHKDLHADEDMGDGGGVLVNCSVLRTKKTLNIFGPIINHLI